MMKRNRIKVQSISNRCGYHTDLKLGQWYDAEERGMYYKIYWGSGASDYAIYDRELFISMEEKRELALEKIGI